MLRPGPLQRALRRADLPAIGANTIGRILHEEGYSVQHDRPWCQTGIALRVRDPHVQEKKD